MCVRSGNQSADSYEEVVTCTVQSDSSGYEYGGSEMVGSGRKGQASDFINSRVTCVWRGNYRRSEGVYHVSPKALDVAPVVMIPSLRAMVSTIVMEVPGETPTLPPSTVVITPSNVTVVSAWIAYVSPPNVHTLCAVGSLVQSKAAVPIEGLSEGWRLGALLGAELGEADGVPLGAAEGVPMGDTLGERLGRPDGDVLGTPLGLTLRISLGGKLGTELCIPDGDELGSELGLELGLPDGTELGTALGSALGYSEGDSLGAELGGAFGGALGELLSHNEDIVFSYLTEALTFDNHISDPSRKRTRLPSEDATGLL
jgi:hypothetical protein